MKYSFKLISTSLTFLVLTSFGRAAENFIIDSSTSHMALQSTISFDDFGLSVLMKPQGEFGFGSSSYSTGLDAQLSGTVRASIDTGAGTISFPGGSNVIVQDSGIWQPGYYGYYYWDWGNYGGFLDLADTVDSDGNPVDIGEGTLVASIRGFSNNVTSSGDIPLSPSGTGTYSFDSTVDFTNYGGQFDYQGLTGLASYLGSGYFNLTSTTIANNAGPGSVAVSPGGIAQLSIPIDTTYSGSLGNLDFVGNTTGLLHFTGEINAYQVLPGTYGNITDLGTLGGSQNQSHAYDINNSGQVVGYSYDENNQQRAFIWQDGVMHNLGAGTLFGNGSSWAWGVNASGIATGDNYAGGNHAVTFLNPGISNVGSLNGPFGSAFARDINDAGQVVGYSTNPQGQQHAFVTIGGVPTDLGVDQSNYYYPSSAAWGINNSGQIVGEESVDGVTRAVIFNGGGSITQLGSIEGPFGEGHARDINDAGQIVGSSSTVLGVLHATLWDHGTVLDLGALFSPNNYSEAHAINALGYVVGSSAGRAFLWHEGTIIDLNSLLPDDSGWVLTDAWGINDHNQIVGWGYRITPGGAYLGEHAFLIQVPEPSTLVLAGFAALGGLISMRRRRGIRS